MKKLLVPLALAMLFASVPAFSASAPAAHPVAFFKVVLGIIFLWFR